MKEIRSKEASHKDTGGTEQKHIDEVIGEGNIGASSKETDCVIGKKGKEVDERKAGLSADGKKVFCLFVILFSDNSTHHPFSGEPSQKEKNCRGEDDGAIG